MPDELDEAWKALSNPIRREMLDRLKAGPLTTGQIDRAFPELSRFAVMQHLGVLERSGLLLVRRTGRRRFNYLNPVPLRMLYERWVGGFMDVAADAALRLKEHAERAPRGTDMQETAQHRTVRIEAEVRLNAPIERVWRALTEEFDQWWAFRTRPDAKIVFDCRPGGTMYEDWGDGNGVQYALITMVEAPHKVRSRSVGGYFAGYNSDSLEELTEDGDGTIHRKSMAIWGDIPKEDEEMFRNGMRMIAEKMFKEYVENGKTWKEFDFGGQK